MTTTHRHLEAARSRNEEFERTLADIAASFVNVPPDKVDGQVVDSLARMSAVIGAERSSPWQRVADGTDFVVTHAWHEDHTTNLQPRERFSAETMFESRLAKLGIVAAGNVTWRRTPVAHLTGVTDLRSSSRARC